MNGDIVVTGRPDLIEQTFKAPPESFAVFAADVVAPLAGRHSVIVKSGAPHKRDRKLLMPPFHGERMRAYGEAIRDVARAALGEIRVGDTVAMLDVGQRVALDVIVRVVSGVAGDDVRAFGAAMTGALDAAHPAFLFSKRLQTPLFPPYARFARVLDDAHRMLRRQIDAARARGPGDDVLSLLLAARDEDGAPMSDDEVVDQLKTLLLAGHETTAIGIAWAMQHVHRDARVKAALLGELAARDAGPEAWATAPYLRAVCDEALRLHPIVPDVMRETVVDFRLGDWTLPAGTTIDLSPTLAHRDPRAFPDAERFWPERFLEKAPSPFSYLPFGGGHRRCIGAAFATYEMRVALATLLTEGAFALVDDVDVPPVRRQLTLAPRGGVRMTRVRAPAVRRAA